MKETIGGTWLTQLVIVFIFLFVAFLALSMNYSKAFRVRNETLSFIEKNEGITEKTLFFINNYYKNNGYNMKGYCDVGMYGFNTSRVTLKRINDSNKKTKFNYCIGKVDSSVTNFKNRSYYKIKLFFKFNLPVMGDIFTFDIEGQTKDISHPYDKNNNKSTCDEKVNGYCKIKLK